jgi:hypothetical protein
MGYFLFLLVNAALFLRPSELIPDLQNAPVYEVLIQLCLAVALPGVVRQLSPSMLRARPITACVVGLQGVVIVSALLNVGPGEAFRSGYDFARLLVYFLLLVAVVDTPNKLRWFVYYLAALICVLTAFALLQYHGAIDIPALASMAERQWEFVNEETGEAPPVVLRLCAAGIFNNPNDLSRILVVGIIISMYGWGDRRSPLPRIFWLALIAEFGYALALTQSRGGFIGLLTTMMAFLCIRFGGRKLIGMALVVLPLLFVAFGGRQTSLSTSTGTGHQRIEIWRWGIEEWRHNPLFGSGMRNYAGIAGGSAHNAFVQAYTETGFIGGTFFLGFLYLAVLFPYLVGRESSSLTDGELRRFRPYLIGIIGGYIMGQTSSSRNYVATTYMLIALAAVYVRLAGVYLPPSVTSLSNRLVWKILLLSMLSVAAIYLFVRISLAGA